MLTQTVAAQGNPCCDQWKPETVGTQESGPDLLELREAGKASAKAAWRDKEVPILATDMQAGSISKDSLGEVRCLAQVVFFRSWGFLNRELCSNDSDIN